jgi:hypothetical protein
MNGVQDYIEAHDLQTRDAADTIEEFGDEIHAMHGKCIDIGCGPATVTWELFMRKLPADATVVGKSRGFADPRTEFPRLFSSPASRAASIPVKPSGCIRVAIASVYVGLFNTGLVMSRI